MSIRDEIKSYLAKEGVTMKSLHTDLTSRHGLTTSYQNFSKKLADGRLRYQEAKQIAEILGYKIIWEKQQ